MIFYIPMLSQPPRRLMWVWSDDHLREMVWMTFHRCLTFELNINSHVYKSPPQDPFFVILLGRLLRNGWELNLSSRTCLSFTKSVPSCHQNSNDQSISTESDVHASTPLNRDLGSRHHPPLSKMMADNLQFHTHALRCCLFVAMWNHSGDRLWYNGRLYRNRLCSDHWWW